MIVFGKIITTAARIKSLLDEAVKRGRNDTERFRQIETIYNCRIFGLCIYSVSHKWKQWPVKVAKHDPFPVKTYHYGQYISPEAQHMIFIYNRMMYVHGEKANVEYMIKFKEVIDKSK